MAILNNCILPAGNHWPIKLTLGIAFLTSGQGDGN